MDIGNSVSYSLWEFVNKSIDYTAKNLVIDSIHYLVWDSAKDSVGKSVRDSVTLFPVFLFTTPTKQYKWT